ncbi:MAG: DNA-processing protein DprA [Lachnospiraceae bacterium]|nr:DNA-processing protein DprA [Lachnospiraceae bacterium]
MAVKGLTELFLCELAVGMSVSVLREAVEEAGTAEEFFELTKEDLFRIGLLKSDAFFERFSEFREPERLEQVLKEAETQGIRFVPESSEAYPKKLLDLPDRPFGLFVRGSLPDPDRRSVAVIGSRKCSTYGKETALFFGEAFARAGLNVISGMALGVDGYAGRGALRADGASFAVLGGGVDICYPRENLDLYEQLKVRGGILSERPPGLYARNFDFPLRNRIISGLSDAVAVIEAAENSGSLITVDHALSQNREVFAVPGRINDRMALGTNRLIREGAEILTCPEDLLSRLGLPVGKDTKGPKKAVLTKEEAVLAEEIRKGDCDLEELMGNTGFPASALMEVLVRLEIKGVIRRENGGKYHLQA